jgi:hypothetical protein
METITNNGKDPELWELAKKRASFKYHLITYLIMNSFFWLVWSLTSQHYEAYGFGSRIHIPWPLWPMFGWGIGLTFHFIGAYVSPGENLVEKEYQKLKNKQL